MDAEKIKIIRAAKDAIDDACLNNGMTAAECCITVYKLEDLQDIAEFIYGDRGEDSIVCISEGGWTHATLMSPEGVRFHYDGFSLTRALFNDQKEEVPA